MMFGLTLSQLTTICIIFFLAHDTCKGHVKSQHESQPSLGEIIIQLQNLDNDIQLMTMLIKSTSSSRRFESQSEPPNTLPDAQNSQVQTGESSSQSGYSSTNIQSASTQPQIPHQSGSNADASMNHDTGSSQSSTSTPPGTVADPQGSQQSSQQPSQPSNQSSNDEAFLNQPAHRLSRPFPFTNHDAGSYQSSPNVPLGPVTDPQEAVQNSPPPNISGAGSMAGQGTQTSGQEPGQSSSQRDQSSGGPLGLLGNPLAILGAPLANIGSALGLPSSLSIPGTEGLSQLLFPNANSQSSGQGYKTLSPDVNVQPQQNSRGQSGNQIGSQTAFRNTFALANVDATRLKALPRFDPGFIRVEDSAIYGNQGASRTGV